MKEPSGINPILTKDTAAESLLFSRLEALIKRHGHLIVTHSMNDSGMGLHWTASLNNEFPYCSSGSLRGALVSLVKRQAELDLEGLKREMEDMNKFKNIS